MQSALAAPSSSAPTEILFAEASLDGVTAMETLLLAAGVQAVKVAKTLPYSAFLSVKLMAYPSLTVAQRFMASLKISELIANCINFLACRA